MTEKADEDIVKKKSPLSKHVLLLGVTSIVSIIGGFYLAYNNRHAPNETSQPESIQSSNNSSRGLEEVSFIPTQSLSIALPRNDTSERIALRFEAQLEVPKHFEENVVEAMPRIMDVLNTYLRAVDVRDLENASMLPELRSQMLRRIRIATDESIIHDLLIQTFIVN